jgi:hypothetical protein
MNISEVHIEIVQYSLIIRHQFGWYSYLHVGAGHGWRQQVLEVIDFLKSRLLNETFVF